MSRRKKVEKWLNVKPRRIFESSSSSSGDESNENSSGCSSILPSNMSLFTSQLLLSETSHSVTVATQVNEDDLLTSKSVATQTKTTRKKPKPKKLPKLKELPPSFDFSTPKRGLSIRSNNVPAERKRAKMATKMNGASKAKMVPFKVDERRVWLQATETGPNNLIIPPSDTSINTSLSLRNYAKSKLPR